MFITHITESTTFSTNPFKKFLTKKDVINGYCGVRAQMYNLLLKKLKFFLIDSVGLMSGSTWTINGIAAVATTTTATPLILGVCFNLWFFGKFGKFFGV